VRCLTQLLTTKPGWLRCETGCTPAFHHPLHAALHQPLRLLLNLLSQETPRLRGQATKQTTLAGPPPRAAGYSYPISVAETETLLPPAQMTFVDVAFLKHALWRHAPSAPAPVTLRQPTWYHDGASA